MSSVKDRLVVLLQKYDPEKVSKADALLAKYVGKEEAFLKQLEKKYVSEAPKSETGGAGTSAAATTPRAAQQPPAAPPQPPQSPSHKDRLIALLQKYDPDKVSKADALLAKYVGKEEAFLKQLEKKYGGESTSGSATPHEAPSSSATPAAGSETPRLAAATPTTTTTTTVAAASPKDRLIVLLKKHDPDKVPKADALLAKYVGKEEAFLNQLAKKYGEPTSGSTTPRSSTPHATTTATPTAATPAASPSKEPVAAEPPSSSSPLSHKDRLVILLKKHDPDKVSKADALLAKYVGKEELFLAQLAKKYGEVAGDAVTPREQQPSQAPPSAPAAQEEERQPTGGSFKDRLVAILKIHEPDKVAKADALLAKYVGKEESFLTQLAKKYGATPTTTTTTATPRNASALPTQKHDEEQQAAASAAASVAPLPLQRQRTMLPAALSSDEAPIQHEQQQQHGENNKNNNDDANDNEENIHDRHDEDSKPHTPTPGSSYSPSGATTPRHVPASSAGLARQQVELQQSEHEKRKLRRFRALQVASAEKFLVSRIEADRRKNWFAVWRAVGQEKVAERIMSSTKTATPPPAELVKALGELRMTPATYARLRYLREQLGLPIDDTQVPRGVAGLSRYVDETVSSAIEFVTVTYPDDLNHQRDSARAEAQQLVSALQKAQERAHNDEKVAGELAEKLRFTELNFEDATKEIEGLHQQNEAQARLTARANNQVKKLQDALAKEQRGIPSEVEQRIEQKDELASHLHKQLASARSSVSQWKEQCLQVQSQLEDERDRRIRAEQRVEVLSVALVPPETLGFSGYNNNNNNNNSSGKMSIAESVRNARELQNQHRDPSLSSPQSQQPQPQQQQQGRTYQEQSRLLAAARKALIAEGSATGGDVPRLLGVSQQQQQQQSPRSGGSSRRNQEVDEGDDVVPPPPTSQPPADGTTRVGVAPNSEAVNKNRAGLNQTPALESNDQQYVSSPSPAVQRSPAGAAVVDDVVDDNVQRTGHQHHVNCPNCETVQLTAFNGSRFSSHPTDADKVAFCFSCRKTFTRIDLETAEKARIKHQQHQQQNQQQRQQSVSNPRVSHTTRTQDKIPASLKSSVAKLQAHRKL